MWHSDYPKLCQWCSVVFCPENPKQLHCCNKHKQAHHRAYKLYVTAQAAACSAKRNAHKKRKKKKLLTKRRYAYKVN